MVFDVNRARQGHAPAVSDAVRTVPHLGDSVAFHLKHAVRHLDAAHEGFHRARAGDPGGFNSAAWNGEHMARHLDGLVEHADKIGEHLTRHTELADYIPTSCIRAIKGSAASVSALGSKAKASLERGMALLPDAEDGDPKAFQGVSKEFETMEELTAAAKEPVKTMDNQIMADPMFADEAYTLSAHNPLPDRHLSGSNGF